MNTVRSPPALSNEALDETVLIRTFAGDFDGRSLAAAAWRSSRILTSPTSRQREQANDSGKSAGPGRRRRRMACQP